MIIPDGKDFLHCDTLDDDGLFALIFEANYSLRTAAAIRIMYRGGEHNYMRAYELCFHKNFKLREIGAFILGEVIWTSSEVERDIRRLLQRLALEDTSSRVRARAVASLGMRCSCFHKICRPLVNIFSSVINDRSPLVRSALAAIILYVPSKKIIPLAEQLLMDEDQNVRHWAAFSTGVRKWDTQIIRDSLISMLDDSLQEGREEAIYTLSVLGDKRVLPALKSELEKNFKVFRMLEAAANLGEPELVPLLKKIVSSYKGDGDEAELNAIKQYRRLIGKIQRQKHKKQR
jgi:HEAT repeat protein